MSQTDGRWTQDLPNTDLQVFRGPNDYADTSAHAVISLASGLYSWGIASTLAATFQATLLGFHRTGMFGNANVDQQQFGTSLLLPGPQASIPNSSSPEGLLPGYPPILAANMATLGAFQRGAIAKGVTVTSIDVIYQVNTVAASLAQVGLTRTVFANNTAPVTTNILALGTNGLATAVQAQPYVINIPINAAFDTASDVIHLSTVNLTAGSGGTINFYGVMFHLSYNFN